jgi:hypothetical protein
MLASEQPQALDGYRPVVPPAAIVVEAPYKGTPPATPSFIYNLAAYRPNGIDTCDGSVAGRSDSAFLLTVHTDAQSLVESWAHHRLEAGLIDAREVRPVEYTLLINGRDENHDAWDDPLQCEARTHEPFTSHERQRVTGLTDTLLAHLREEHRRAQWRGEIEAASEADAATAAARVTKETSERAELERLQAKYGDAPD